MDPGMNQLLKWSIENSERPSTDPKNPSDPNPEREPSRPLNADALRSLMGGPSDADLMKESMTALLSPQISLENKLVAFDNFEQLIENIDNANNMESLGLWTPLIGLLKSEEPDLRRYAAWCAGTAVQNNVRAQERLLIMGGIPTLAKMAVEDEVEIVRRKAIYALSSVMRNFQPALDVAVRALPKVFAPEGAIDAANMEAVDRIVSGLREASSNRAG